MDIYLKILIAVACIITMLLSLFGNGLVISVILRYKRLKNSTNYILLSLAIADLTVSLLVMLPAMTQDVLNKWIFSNLFCKFYNAFDVTCCTASILHLLLVAIDRYIAIFKPLTYKNVVRKWHVFVMVISIWTLSLCMSFIPIFLGWNMLGQNKTTQNSTNSNNLINNSFTQDTYIANVTTNELCILQANIAFSLISSSLSFYIPLIIMIGVYFRIYIVAKRQAKSIAQIQYNSRYYNNNHSSNTLNNVSLNNTDEILNDKEIDQILLQNGEYKASEDKSDKSSRIVILLKSLKNIEKKRTQDNKAIKTVGIIMGIFILCWLPFFIMYCTVPIIQLYDSTYKTPYFVERIITWIGYVNSFINPIVYALTYRDFRKAYVETLRALARKFCPIKRNTYQDNYFSESQLRSQEETFCSKFFKLCCKKKSIVRV